MNDTQHGHLLLADIAGYTSYVAATELTHSQEILTELLELIIERFKPLMTISKIEGDAIFAYAPELKIPRGETILELIEATYVAFRGRRDAVHRRTTCTCNACRNIPNLDLKFIAHHGEYFVQSIAGTKELVGSDVNLIHRLLKNHVIESTGWHAYALFTEQSLSHLEAQPAGLFEQRERYEHLGEVRTLSMDLHARYQELMDARRVLVTAEEAHQIFDHEYRAAPQIIWEWFNDPHKRSQWMTSEIVPILRVRGRISAGARNHCVHGRNQVVVEDVLDIRPIEYYTVRHTPQGTSASLLLTFNFTPTDSGGTRVRLLVKAQLPFAPNWFKHIFCRIVTRVQLLKLWRLEKIDELIQASVS
ncbi:MAG TPA: DUF2652 domain-containing protein [Anaerolineales bacterium]|nr:DUF2652 domain-containing protein [Anaerolineales bacterium]